MGFNLELQEKEWQQVGRAPLWLARKRRLALSLRTLVPPDDLVLSTFPLSHLLQHRVDELRCQTALNWTGVIGRLHQYLHPKEALQNFHLLLETLHRMSPGRGSFHCQTGGLNHLLLLFSQPVETLLLVLLCLGSF